MLASSKEFEKLNKVVSGEETASKEELNAWLEDYARLIHDRVQDIYLIESLKDDLKNLEKRVATLEGTVDELYSEHEAEHDPYRNG